ncbi:hypothetical protein ABZT48_21455 [Streptomyces avermitilis]|uniref:hypothetical protein n=1 Tax=Streptomyces avermitilis TaxID=33903 RepID=UPI0033A36B1E
MSAPPRERSATVAVRHSRAAAPVLLHSSRPAAREGLRGLDEVPASGVDLRRQLRRIDLGL